MAAQLWIDYPSLELEPVVASQGADTRGVRNAALMTVYSHSRIASFEKCPKQFHYRYVLEIPAEREGIEAFMGKRVHEVLERLYEFAVRGQIPSLEQVVFRYHAFWDEHFDDKFVSIAKSGTPPSFYRDLGARCIDYYYRRFHPFDQAETLGVEEEIQFTLDEAGRYHVRGIVDRVVRGQDGAIEVHDYKTGRFIPAQKELNQDRQLALYELGLRERYGDDQSYRLVWHFLQRKEQRTSSRTPEQLAALRRDTIAAIDRIEAATEYPVQRNRLCDWCEYKDRCFAEHP